MSNNLEWFTRSNALDASKKHEYTLLFKARYFKIASLSANIHVVYFLIIYGSVLLRVDGGAPGVSAQCRLMRGDLGHLEWL